MVACLLPDKGSLNVLHVTCMMYIFAKIVEEFFGIKSE